MRKFTFLLISLMVLSGLHKAAGDELSDAYMKEYTFLKAQKDELAKRLEKELKQQTLEIAQAKKKVTNLQDEYVALSKKLKNEESSIEKSEEQLRNKAGNKEIIDNIISQAKMVLEDYGVKVDDAANSEVDTLTRAFKDAAKLYTTLSSIRVEDGRFYLADGTVAEGEIVLVGNIAAYGISEKAGGALAPAGNGEYKIWNKKGSGDDALALFNKELPATIDIFLFENLDNDIEYQNIKTYKDVVKSGGIIGYVILILGSLGLSLILFRIVFLLRSRIRMKKINKLVHKKIESGSEVEAYNAIKKFKDSTAQVIKATLKNITGERERMEDIVTETIINESRALDRFGNFILVIAAVSPLLGLLGTVTGIINTFDIITIHGTGDPKLLSGGISEALVTTMLGLMVAIPLILLGNLSNGWAENIKDSIEQSSLHVVNLFDKYSNAK